MNRPVKSWQVLALTGLLAAGCGRGDDRSAAPGDREAGGEQYVLAEEPAGARGIIAARKEARDGDEVVVVGRIGGDRNPWVEGRAMFVIVDPSPPDPTVKPCPEEEGCPTPWDYCCADPEALRKAK